MNSTIQIRTVQNEKISTSVLDALRIRSLWIGYESDTERSDLPDGLGRIRHLQLFLVDIGLVKYPNYIFFSLSIKGNEGMMTRSMIYIPW
jgi:hypothetical protein